MRMNIPAYMSIQENDENRTRTLSILDADDRKQREMWGEQFWHMMRNDAAERRAVLLTFCAKRHRESIPGKSHSRSE